MPLSAAGMRKEPPVSVPSPARTRPAAIAERVNEFGTPGVMRLESKQVWSRVVSSPFSVD